jgi:hypothetical protein
MLAATGSPPKDFGFYSALSGSQTARLPPVEAPSRGSKEKELCPPEE